MDYSNHNLEIAEACTSVIDNAAKMSFETTEVSPTNNSNKDDSEIFDDSMVCDDNSCIDKDVDVRKDEVSQYNIVEIPPVAVTEEIPPKYDTSCSEVVGTYASPKSKKRKLSSFDELLENLHSNDSNVLILNFTKLLLFLESKNKELTFPNIVKEYEEFIEMLVQDINILKSKNLDADYRDICDKILAAATGYLLTCVYEYRPNFQKKVLVIKKKHNNMMDQSENGTFSLNCSRQSIMLSSQSSSEVDSNEVLSRSPSPGPISSGFKIDCLRTTLAFVKNDVTKTKEFPDLNLEQAQFMNLLLESVLTFTEFDNNLEIKELYRALWEAVRIYSLKYEFRIECVESSGGKKSLVFEKVTKQKPSTTAVNTNQIMNPKTDLLKTEDSKTEAPKSEAPKPEAPIPEASKTDAPEDSKSKAPKPEVAKPEASKQEAPKTDAPETSKLVPPKPETSKSKPWFPMPEIPKFVPYVNQKPTGVTKRMLKRKLRIENENLFIKTLPAKFICDTLNTIHDFLLDEERFTLVFVPNTHNELEFYKKCLKWCRTTCAVWKFGDEFQEMHYQISCLLSHVNCTVNKGRNSKINETTGMKEVTYTKAKKYVPAHSAPKKKKLNLQNALRLAGMDNIKLASVINLNQSLRNKKKNKKLKNAKLKANNSAGASKEAFVKPTNQAKTWTDGSSSTCSSRGTSRDRSKAAARAQSVAKKAMNEMNQSAMKTSRSRRGEQTIRKEQLMEALSVPVQSDKAMRMMRGMGWSGGALGARGNGITEPLMPTLELSRGAGLGHSSNAQYEKIARKPRECKTAPSFVSKNFDATRETDKTENDVIVQKTKQLLLQNLTFDSLIKLMEPQKPKANNAELPTPTKSTVGLEKLRFELPQPTKPLPTQTKTAVELPKPIKANVEPPKPTTSNSKPLKPLPTLTKFSIALQQPENSNLEFPLRFRQEMLHSILELLNSDATSKTLNYDNKLCNKSRKFVRNALLALKRGSNYGMFRKEEHEICGQIQEKYKKLPLVVLEALICYDFKTLELKKKVLAQQELPIITQLSLKVNTETISEKNLYSYINSSGTHYESEKAYEALKFKVLFLLNILSFVKSLNEEVDITFNKALNVKQKTYVENVIDEVNMRIKFGSSPAETNLCAEIKNHVKDAFLGFIFNHQYTVVTLNKYFRFKRLNRPHNAVKRTCQTTVNLDAFSSETFSKAKLNTNETTNKENNSNVAENNNKVTENKSTVADNNNGYVAYENNAVALPEKPEGNELEPYDSDNNGDEEYNNNTCSVRKLPLGEEGVKISNFLYLNDKEKTNTADFKNNSINNDSASKNTSNVIDNRNKNNSGNGNVVIDNNDNQVIDMKRDSDNSKTEKKIVDTEMADYVMCVDYTEEVVNSGEMTVDISKEKEANISGNNKDSEEIDQPIKHSNIVVANVVEKVNQSKEIGINNIAKIIEVLSNTEDTIDQNVIVVEDSDSNSDTETIVKNKIQNGDNPSKNDKDIKEDTDVIMIEIDDEPMEVISIREESIEVIDKEDLVKVINKDVSVELINRGESMEEINKVESSRDVQIVKGDLGIKTDGYIISKEKLVLSEDICDTHSLGLSDVKTVDTVTDAPNFHINNDIEIKNVLLVHRNHPNRKLNNEEVKAIQIHISNRIVRATQLPLFKCHGVQNGAIIYTCHNKNTYDWLHSLNSASSFVKILNTEVTKMALKFYCFFNFDTKDFFKMIELYNQELSTKDWVVEKTEKDGDFVTLIVRMDKFSVKFIQESDLALFAGIDKVLCSLICE